MIVQLVFEGFDAAILPCSFILLVPGLACLLAGRQESTSAGIGYGASAAVIGWLYHSGRVDRPPDGVLALAAGASLVALAVPLVRRLDLVALAGGALAGAVAVLIWVPCPSETLTQLLGELPDRGLSGLFLFLAHLAGVLAPMIVIGALLHVVPNPATLPIRPAMLVVGGLVLAALALTVAVGLDDELVRWLADRSRS